MLLRVAMSAAAVLGSLSFIHCLAANAVGTGTGTAGAERPAPIPLVGEGPPANGGASTIPSHEPAEDWGPRFGAARRSAYELDDRDRSPPADRQKPECDASEIVPYRGVVLRYDAAVGVHPAFVERLVRFERLVQDVAVEVYGRAPKTIHQGGAFACRTTVTGKRWSEHAFGNALDIEGFSFDPVDAASERKLRARGIELEPGARRAFRVHVGETWKAEGRAIDKRFYATLLERLRAREDVFRAIIGPPDPAHTTHLHLDVGPWAYGRYQLP